MNRFELVQRIEKFAPLDTQEKWDCSGWLVTPKGKNEVYKVMLALTVTDDIVRQAREKDCDMLISHHPLFCVPIKYSDLNIYCAHTNMDKADGGTTDTLIKYLGFDKFKRINEFVRIVEMVEPVSVSEFANKLRRLFPYMRYINNHKVDKISTIGFCAGSGSELISDTDADAFVTGDLKFHTALESDCVVFDIGHFESEILILPIFKKILGIDVVFADEKSPFVYD